MQITIRNQDIGQESRRDLDISSRKAVWATGDITLLIISIGNEKVEVLSSEVRAAVEALEKAS